MSESVPNETVHRHVFDALMAMPDHPVEVLAVGLGVYVWASLPVAISSYESALMAVADLRSLSDAISDAAEAARVEATTKAQRDGGPVGSEHAATDLDSEQFPPAGAKTYKLFAVAGDSGDQIKHESDACDIEGAETEESLNEEAWEFALECVRPEGWYRFYDADGRELEQ